MINYFLYRMITAKKSDKVKTSENLSYLLNSVKKDSEEMSGCFAIFIFSATVIVLVLMFLLFLILVY